MERELEKTLMEIECAIKNNEQRGNTHTQSVLEQAREIVEMCAQAAQTPFDLKEILERDTAQSSEEIRDAYGDSDDLISRKALLKKLREIMDEPYNTTFLIGIGAAVSIIEHKEIAFDKEKVIEELNAERKPIYREDGSLMSNKTYISIDNAIEIVERGGIE